MQEKCRIGARKKVEGVSRRSTAEEVSVVDVVVWKCLGDLWIYTKEEVHVRDETSG